MHRFPANLLDGYKSFMSERYEKDRYRELAKDGQNPTTMVIACCDSRAAPETIFDAGPGELFVLRNVANLVPTFQPDGGQPSPPHDPNDLAAASSGRACGSVTAR